MDAVIYASASACVNLTVNILVPEFLKSYIYHFSQVWKDNRNLSELWKKFVYLENLENRKETTSSLSFHFLNK